MNILDYTEPREDFLARCDQEGLRVVKPAPNELFVDIDSEEGRVTFNRVWPMFCPSMGAIIIDRHPSKSGLPHEHIVIQLTGVVVTELERIALQAMLGSDGKRELFGYLRQSEGIEPVTVFVEAREEVF